MEGIFVTLSEAGMFRDVLFVSVFGIALWHFSSRDGRGSNLVISLNTTYDYIVGKLFSLCPKNPSVRGFVASLPVRLLLKYV